MFLVGRLMFIFQFIAMFDMTHWVDIVNCQKVSIQTTDESFPGCDIWFWESIPHILLELSSPFVDRFKDKVIFIYHFYESMSKHSFLHSQVRNLLNEEYDELMTLISVLLLLGAGISEYNLSWV